MNAPDWYVPSPGENAGCLLRLPMAAHGWTEDERQWALDHIARLEGQLVEATALFNGAGDLIDAQQATIDRLTHEGGLIAQALGDLVVAMGIAAPDMAFTGIELLHLADCAIEAERGGLASPVPEAPAATPMDQASVTERLSAYEYDASVVGQRRVLKLTADQAAQVIFQSAYRRAASSTTDGET